MRAAIRLLLAAILIGATTPAPGTVVHAGEGIQCQPSYRDVRGPHAPPITYAAADVGKPGVPRLTAQERALLHRIEYYVKSGTLRIAWLNDAPPQHRFIIYDADAGPCYAQSRAYPVLNGNCLEYYGPADDPYETLPVPDCDGRTPYPWMTPTPTP
ncbi:MAG: hypothetical protein ABR949_15580 [Candidatus Aquilonibacter sp.]|jgi:hypothetical protein